MFFLFNLVVISLSLVMALAIAAAASAPQTALPGDDQPENDVLAATGARALPSQFSNGASPPQKMPAVVAAGLQ